MRCAKKETFIQGTKNLAVGKSKNEAAKRISTNAEKYGSQLYDEFIINNKHYDWHPYREKTIIDHGKTRNLKIPCLKDQVMQLIWLIVAIPVILARNYYYNCGSIDHAGQTRCIKGLQKWLKNPKNKYGATLDIRKFYDTCPHVLVRKGLEAIIKDKDFIDFGMSIVDSMSDTDTGLAIGFPSSHWFANIALSKLDHSVVQNYPSIHYVRYMDDMALVSSNKKELAKAVHFIKQWIEDNGMRLKKWECFSIAKRGLSFLSYRFYNGYTLLKKDLMIRISRRAKKAVKNLNHHNAAIITFYGILKYCNSQHFKEKWLYPFNLRKSTCCNIVSRYARKEARSV